MDKKRKKWNARELFFMIKEELEKEGLIPDDILDYSSAGSASELILAEEFDVVPHIVHGACEGIYMDIRLEAGECARVFSTPKPELRLGTFKTLQTDKEAYKKTAMMSSTGRGSILRPSGMLETPSGRCGHPVTNGHWNMPVSSQADPVWQHML